MGKWSIDLKKYAEGYKAKIKKVRVNYAFALYSSIVKKTPAKTGRARANWNVSVGSVDTSTTEETKKTGLKHKMTDIKLDGDESIYISNNLPYITTLEYGGYPSPVKKGTYDKKTKTWEIRSAGGFSKQAPNGMLGVTLANNENIFKAAVKRAENDGI